MTTRSDISTAKKINLSAMRWLEQKQPERMMEFGQTRDWTVCVFTNDNSLEVCSEIMQMKLSQEES